MMTRLLLAWVGLIPLMILNGIARETLYGPAVGELRAHQLSTLTGVAILFVYTLVAFPWLHVDTPAAAWRVGWLWMLLTVVFEFGFGHYVAGHPWSRLLHDYDLLAGRVWSVFLLAVVLVPPLVFALRH